MCTEVKTAAPEAAKTPKDRLFEALSTAVSSLKALSVGDSFSIAYVDHQFSVSYSMRVEGEADGN